MTKAEWQLKEMNSREEAEAQMHELKQNIHMHMRRQAWRQT